MGSEYFIVVILCSFELFFNKTCLFGKADVGGGNGKYTKHTQNFPVTHAITRSHTLGVFASVLPLAVSGAKLITTFLGMCIRFMYEQGTKGSFSG